MFVGRVLCRYPALYHYTTFGMASLPSPRLLNGLAPVEQPCSFLHSVRKQGRLYLREVSVV